MMIHVVTGPPGAGKTTLIQERRAESDLVIDLDAMTELLGSRDAAFSERTRQIDAALTGQYKQDVWIIHCQPSRDQLSRYVAAGCQIMVVDPGEQTVRARATAMARPLPILAAINRWYASPLSYALEIELAKLRAPYLHTSPERSSPTISAR